MKNRKKPQYILTLLIFSLTFMFSIGLAIWIITDTIIVKPSETDQTNQIIIEYLDKQDGTYNGNILLPSNTAFGLDINSERLTYSYKKENSDGTYPAEFTEVDLENKSGPIDAGNYKIKVSFVNYDNPETPIEQELDFVVKPRSIEDAEVVFDREDGNLFYVGHTYDNFVEKLQVSIVLVENAQATNLIIDDDFTVSTPDLSTLNNNAETKIIGKGNYTDELTVNYSVENPELIVELSTEHSAYDKNTGAYVFEYSKSGIDFNGVIIVKDPLTKEKVTPTSIEYSYKGLAEQGDYINLGLPSTVATYWVKAVVSLTGYDSVTVDSIQVKINPVSISTAVVTLADTILTYNGAPQTKTVESVVFDGDTLVEGEDYEAPVYSNNIDAGNMKAVVTINGKGMYADSVKVYFTIEKATPTVTAPTYAKDAFIEGEQPKITTAGKGTFIKTKGDGTKETTPTVISGTIISKINGVDIDVHPFEEGTSSTNTVTVTYTFVPSDVNSNGTSNYNQATTSKTLTMYGVAYNSGSKNYYGTLKKGISAATTQNPSVWVVPDIYKNTTFYPTLKENAEIPSGITFGLAYMIADNGDVTPDAVYNDTDPATSASSSANPSRAIIDEGVTLTVKSGGTLRIGSFVGDTGTVSKAAVLMNNGSIIINSGGTVYSYGYTKGSGLFKLESGGTIYDVLKIYDFAGGRYAPGMYFKEFYAWASSIPQERLNNILPFQSFSMHNISCELKIYAGATFYTRADLNVSNTIYVQNIVLFGTGGLFQLSATEGFSENYVKRTVENTVNNNDFNSEWDSTNQSVYQKEVYEFNTSVKDNPIKMHIEMDVKITNVDLDFQTDKYTAMPIGMMDITIKNGHTLTIESNSWKFLPGSRLFIEQGAKLIVDSGVNIILYEDYYDNFTAINNSGNPISPASFSYYSKHPSLYDTTTKKVKADYVTKMYIDGTLECNGNIGGTISTTSNTGRVVLSSGSATLRRLRSITYLDESTVINAATGWANFGGKVYDDVHATKMYLYNGSTINSYSDGVAQGEYKAITDGDGKSGWYATEVSIYYDLNGGTGTTPSSKGPFDSQSGYLVQTNDVLQINPNPTRNGYVYGDAEEKLYWALDPEGTRPVIPGETKLYASTVFYAIWKLDTFDINYVNVYYGSNSTDSILDENPNESTYTILDFVSFKTPTKYDSNGDEMVLGGFFTDISCSDEFKIENMSNEYGDKTIYIYWYPADSTTILINYVLAVDEKVQLFDTLLTPVSEKAVIIGEDLKWDPKDLAVFINEDESKDGYFTQWYFDSIYSDPYEEVYAEVMKNVVTENNQMILTLYSKILPKLELEIANDGITYEGQDKYYIPGQEFDLPACPQLADGTPKPGYKFVGWSETGCTISENKVTVSDGATSLKLTATYEKIVMITITVTANATGLTSLTSANYTATLSATSGYFGAEMEDFYNANQSASSIPSDLTTVSKGTIIIYATEGSKFVITIPSVKVSFYTRKIGSPNSKSGLTITEGSQSGKSPFTIIVGLTNGSVSWTGTHNN